MKAASRGGMRANDKLLPARRHSDRVELFSQLEKNADGLQHTSNMPVMARSTSAGRVMINGELISACRQPGDVDWFSQPEQNADGLQGANNLPVMVKATNIDGTIAEYNQPPVY